MNEWQTEKCRRIAGRTGFDGLQDRLVEKCEALTEVAYSTDYNSFIEALADMSIITEQLRLSLDKSKQEQYFSSLNKKIDTEWRSLKQPAPKHTP